MKPQIGDKIRVKTTKTRGVIESVDGQHIRVRLDIGAFEAFTEAELTNYSLAARKAWQNMPKRRVGRPKGTTTTDRISVTLRIDRELWEAFRRAEARGDIDDRTDTINKWIAENLRELSD